MREYLEVLQPLLAQTRVEYVGAEQRIRLQLTLPGVTAPPVLLGALGPQMLRLAGRLADGVAIWLGGARYLRDFALPRLLEVAAAANRPDPRIAVGLPVAVCDDPEIGREAIAKLVDPSAALPSYRAVLERGGAERPSDVALIGPESLVAEQLAELADLGVSDFNAIVVPVPGETGSRERTLSLLASRARARG
jgi:alkanesulfonate monooxygenase SsuD/methylene tetrahydromethanopterin reductase-like flavin-dependent oxidoreductase (luciferase family)